MTIFYIEIKEGYFWTLTKISIKSSTLTMSLRSLACRLNTNQISFKTVGAGKGEFEVDARLI